MFERLLHSDWSVDTKKRWLADARRGDGGWRIVEVRRVGDSTAFVDDIFSGGSRTLAGFDFPVGLPDAYGAQTDLGGFPAALMAFGEGQWSEFFDVADLQDEVAITRPFYPLRSVKGVSRSALVHGLGVEKFDDLLRVCERKTDGRNAACSIFWTLGGNQVGKGAISGWREVIRPALARGASLWPFEGALRPLADRHAVVLAETYPAAAYEVAGVVFRRSESKRRQADRAAKAEAITGHCEERGIGVASAVHAMIAEGFGPSKSGEDPFDALAGLLMMIEVADNRWPEAKTRRDESLWEGWILGV